MTVLSISSLRGDASWISPLLLWWDSNCSSGAVEREGLGYSEISLPFLATIYLSVVFMTLLKISVMRISTVCAVLKHRDANKCSVCSF